MQSFIIEKNFNTDALCIMEIFCSTVPNQHFARSQKKLVPSSAEKVAQ